MICQKTTCVYNKDDGRDCSHPDGPCCSRFTPPDSNWVEFDIVDEAFTIEFAEHTVSNHWQDIQIAHARAYRTLPDGRVLTKFGGWYWPCVGWSSAPQFDTNEDPTKLRFWAERISK